MTDDSLPRASRRVADALAERGHDGEVRVLSDSARTAADAAAALGVAQAQIVKSLVFRGTRSGEPILVLLGGASRVEPAALETHLGEPVERADADWIRERTGFAIGGIPPVGHDPPLRTVADAGLVQEPELWAAGGTPHTVFPLRGDELLALTGAELATVAADAIARRGGARDHPRARGGGRGARRRAVALGGAAGTPSRSSGSSPRRPRRLLIARDGGRIVGMLTLVVFPIPTGVRAWIEDVVVTAARAGAASAPLLNRGGARTRRASWARAPSTSPRGPSARPRTASTRGSGFERRETNVYRFEPQRD